MGPHAPAGHRQGRRRETDAPSWGPCLGPTQTSPCRQPWGPGPQAWALAWGAVLHLSPRPSLPCCPSLALLPHPCTTTALVNLPFQATLHPPAPLGPKWVSGRSGTGTPRPSLDTWRALLWAQSRAEGQDPSHDRNVSNTESGKRAPAPFGACRVRDQQGGGEASWRRQGRVEERGTRRCRRKAGRGLPPPPGPSCCEPPSAHLAARPARPRRPAGRGPEASAAPRTAPPGAQPPTPATPLQGGRSPRAALLRDGSAAPGEGEAGGCDGDAQSRPRCSRQRPGSPGLPIGAGGHHESAQGSSVRLGRYPLRPRFPRRTAARGPPKMPVSPTCPHGCCGSQAGLETLGEGHDVTRPGYPARSADPGTPSTKTGASRRQCLGCIGVTGSLV